MVSHLALSMTAISLGDNACLRPQARAALPSPCSPRLAQSDGNACFMLPAAGVNFSCNLETDDDGMLLWAQDHDEDPSTPLACAGYDPLNDQVRDPFGYDAVFAVAHALHEMLEVQNRSAVVGSELLETLIKQVSFDDVTGLVSFFDAS